VAAKPSVGRERRLTYGNTTPTVPPHGGGATAQQARVRATQGPRLHRVVVRLHAQPMCNSCNSRTAAPVGGATAATAATAGGATAHACIERCTTVIPSDKIWDLAVMAHWPGAHSPTCAFVACCHAAAEQRLKHAAACRPPNPCAPHLQLV